MLIDTVQELGQFSTNQYIDQANVERKHFRPSMNLSEHEYYSIVKYVPIVGVRLCLLCVFLKFVHLYFHLLKCNFIKPHMQNSAYIWHKSTKVGNISKLSNIFELFSSFVCQEWIQCKIWDCYPRLTKPSGVQNSHSNQQTPPECRPSKCPKLYTNRILGKQNLCQKVRKFG